MASCLQVEGLRWRRGEFVLQVDRLDLALGRLYPLFGANGAGKSSLLRLLALLEWPEEGMLCLGGEIATNGNRRRLRRAVTLVEQEPWLLRGTVEGNLAYGLVCRGIGGTERRERIDAALVAVGLEGYGARLAQALSVGEGRRVALARALALRPRLLLLDEPAAGLDRASRTLVETLLPTLVAAGTTVVIATHEGRLAERLGAEALRLVRGRLQAGG